MKRFYVSLSGNATGSIPVFNNQVACLTPETVETLEGMNLKYIVEAATGRSVILICQADTEQLIKIRLTFPDAIIQEMQLE